MAKTKRKSAEKVATEKTDIEAKEHSGEFEAATPEKPKKIKTKKKIVKKVKVASKLSAAHEGQTAETASSEAVKAAAAASVPACSLCDGLVPSVAFRCRGCGKTIAPGNA